MWNLDISLAIVGFIVQCGFALLGLTMTGWKHRTVFWLLVLLGGIVSGIAVKRGLDSSERVEKRLEVIQNQNSDLQAKITAFQFQTDAALQIYHNAGVIRRAEAQAPSKQDVQSVPSIPPLQQEHQPEHQPEQHQAVSNSVAVSTSMAFGASDFATAVVTLGPEHLRRNAILETLRNKYILSHGLLIATKWPPLDWMNGELANLGENWRVAPADKPDELDFKELDDSKKP